VSVYPYVQVVTIFQDEWVLIAFDIADLYQTYHQNVLVVCIRQQRLPLFMQT
jgi:hypothetical protein